MGQITRNGDMIRFYLMQVFAKNGKNFIPVPNSAVQFPSQVTKEPFIDKITSFNLVEACDMQVGKMSQDKSFLCGRNSIYSGVIATDLCFI